MKNKKMFVISISIILIIVIIICFLVFNNKSEKQILYCYKESNQQGITQFMGYKIIEGKEFIKIKQENKVTLSDGVYNAFVEKGYSAEFLNLYFENYIMGQLNEELKKYDEFLTYKVTTETKNYSVNVEYIINLQSEEIFNEMFKFDFYNSKVTEMIAYFEGGGMTCERK